MTADSVGPERLVRVEKGHATPEELGALVAVLLAGSASAQNAVEVARAALSGPGWRGDVTPPFLAPHSWQAAPW